MVDARSSGRGKPTADARPSRRLGAVLEGLVEDELLEWYLMTVEERWVASQRLWATFELLGGSLDPQPDSQRLEHDITAIEAALSQEEARERELDREYWAPLRAELEQMGRRRR